MSTVLTRLPLTTTSRRLPCPAPAAGAPAAFVIAHPINASPANALVSNSPPTAITSLRVGSGIISERRAERARLAPARLAGPRALVGPHCPNASPNTAECLRIPPHPLYVLRRAPAIWVPRLLPE